MKLTFKDTNHAVIDEVFDEKFFKDFCKYFSVLQFAYRSMSSWQKVWKINDGQVLAGASYFHSKAPFDSPMDLVHQTVLALAKQHLEDIVGKEGIDWDDLFFTPYIYPAGTKISWHNDTGYAGACIFYSHLEWSPSWGGELMIAKTPTLNEFKNATEETEEEINRKHINPFLNHYGRGVYVAPVPNRMVFTKGDVWHQINRVDQAAGDNVRCSIVGFFTRNSKIELS